MTLAALATACGFLAFLPTAYRGLSELGLIAGVGMLIAFLTSITLLPSLLIRLKPSSEPRELGYKYLAPVDEFLERHRTLILIITGVLIIGAAPGRIPGHLQVSVFEEVFDTAVPPKRLI